MRGAGVKPAVPTVAPPHPQDGNGAGPPFATPPCARRPGCTLPRALCVVPCTAGLPLDWNGNSLLSCRDVEANPGPQFPDWGRQDYAFLPDLVQEACSRLGVVPVRDAFATPTNRRFPAFSTKAEDAFAQACDYQSAGALWANPPIQPP